MLYYRALTHGLAPLPAADPQVRAALDLVAQATGWPAMHAELAARDPVAASRIQPADAQRIQRALEVLQLTGERLSDLQQQSEPPAVRLARFALMPVSRPELYVRINVRFDQMVAAGLVDEVRALWARGGLDPDLPSLRAVGYRQIWQYLAGECSLEAAVAVAQQATRNLAKRQLTWLRGDPAIAWVPSLAERDLVPIYDAVSSAAGKIGAKPLC
jgi:tRNA dimethylallyltransferase